MYVSCFFFFFLLSFGKKHPQRKLTCLLLFWLWWVTHRPLLILFRDALSCGGGERKGGKCGCVCGDQLPWANLLKGENAGQWESLLLPPSRRRDYLDKQYIGLFSPSQKQYRRKPAVCDWPLMMYCKQSKRNSINRHSSPLRWFVRVSYLLHINARVHRTSARTQRKSRLCRNFVKGHFLLLSLIITWQIEPFFNKLGNEHVSAHLIPILDMFSVFFPDSKIGQKKKGKGMALCISYR